MGEKMNGEYNFESGATAFNYNNVTGGGDSASGGSGGSGMECMQLRSSPGPFHYLISEQAKSLVALQELQNEVGALLEFRDLVIETFPNLRSKMAPSMPAATRRDWEPGVRVRRKLAAAGDARTKPQPSVQDSGFSTETSCGKDAHSSSASASASASRSRPLEDELWALLDVIQRKGGRLRDEAELLRAELDERPPPDTAEESFARALQSTPECEGCAERVRLRAERDALLARSAALEAAAALAASPRAPLTPRTPLGRLDRLLSPSCPRVATPDSRKFTAILLESNPVELQRQLLTATVQNQVYEDKLQRVAAQRTVLVQRLEQARDHNDDLRFRLEEKNIELEGARARLRQLEGHKKGDSLERSRSHSSMRDMEPLALPDEDREPTLGDTPRRRPSRIPLHTAHKGSMGTVPRPPRSPAPCSQPARPPSAHSGRSAASSRGRAPPPPRKPDCKPPAPRRPQPPDNKKPAEGWAGPGRLPGGERGHSLPRADLVAEYVARTERLAPLFPRLHTVRTRPTPVDLILDSRLAYQTPQNLALELCKSILYENVDSIDIKNLKSLNSHGEDSLWNGKPQQYFESMNYAEQTEGGDEVGREAYSEDSLAP